MPRARPTSQWEKACSQKYASNRLATAIRRAACAAFAFSAGLYPACVPSECSRDEQPAQLDSVALGDGEGQPGRDALLTGRHEYPPLCAVEGQAYSTHLRPVLPQRF